MLPAMKTMLVALSLALVLLPLGGCGSPEADVDNGTAANANGDSSGGEQGKPKPPPGPPPTIGTYKLDVEALKKRFTAAIDRELNSLEHAMLKSFDEASGTVVLKDEAVFSMHLGGAERADMEGTWTLDEDKLKLTAGSDVQVARLADGVITMVVDDTPTGTRTFIRQPDEPKDAEEGKADQGKADQGKDNVKK